MCLASSIIEKSNEKPSNQQNLKIHLNKEKNNSKNITYLQNIVLKTNEKEIDFFNDFTANTGKNLNSNFLYNKTPVQNVKINLLKF